MKYTEIATHIRPHLDEIAAIWLLRKFGDGRFPGAGAAKVTFTTARQLAARGGSAEQLERQGILLLGIGGGRFDEHPTAEREKRSEECAATLVAKELGVDGDPALQKILRFVRAIDVEGSASPFDVSYLVKVMHNQLPDHPERVISWAMAALDAKYHEQEQFLRVLKPEFEAKAQVEEIRVGNRTERLVAIQSDLENIHKYARSESGARAAVVIQRRSGGNVSIHGDKKPGVDLNETAKLLRLAEQAAKGRIVTSDDERLTSEGQVPGAEEWFYHKRGQMLLNGSLTAPDVPPTHLSLDQIRELVLAGFDETRLKPFCASSGRCVGDLCDWHRLNLERCRLLRSTGG